MSFRVPVIVAGLLSALGFSEARSSCICVGPTVEERIESAAAVFVGTAVDRSRTTGPRFKGTLLRTTFAVRKRWKGPLTDTLETRSYVTGGCGAYFVAGKSYLVVAGRDPYGFNQYGCFGAIPADSIARYHGALGEPAWIAPEGEQRDDENAPSDSTGLTPNPEDTPTFRMLRSSTLDSLRAVELLRRSASALEVSKRLRDDETFKVFLTDLFDFWGVDWDPPFSLHAPTPAEIVESLMRSGRTKEAIAIAERQEAGYPRDRTLRVVFEWLAQRGSWERSLWLSDSLGSLPLGVRAVLETDWPGAPSWRTKVDHVSRFLNRARMPGELQDEWEELIDYAGKHDFHTAWALADRRLVSSYRMDMRLVLLESAYDDGTPRPDSLVMDTYRRIERSPDGEDRVQTLHWLEEVCQDLALEVCAELEFPVRQRTPTQLSWRLGRLLYNGQFDEAKIVSDSLRVLVPSDRHALALARGLWSVTIAGPCLLDEPCAEAYESRASSWLPRLEEVAIDHRGPVADSLNAHLAGLFASSDSNRAWDALDRIGGEEVRSDGLAKVAIVTIEEDFELAFAALRERGSAAGTGISLEREFLDSKANGDEEGARQILALMPSGRGRMHARLRWAQKVARDGNLSEARRIALASLEEWKPSTDYMKGSRGQFNVFLQLEAFDRLIQWAMELEDPDDRAAALAAVVGSVSRHVYEKS